MTNVISMYYKNNKRTSLFVWIMGEEGTIVLTPSHFTNDFVMARNGKGNEIWGRWGQKIKIQSEGIWELELNPIGIGTPINIEIVVDGDAYPFLIPEPGIIPSHLGDLECLWC